LHVSGPFDGLDHEPRRHGVQPVPVVVPGHHGALETRANFLRGSLRGSRVMLINLLPGLRELRAPLASGYVWLLVGWLILASLVPPADTATGAWRDIYRLGEGLGKSGALVAVTFAAYIVGILNERVAFLLARVVVSIQFKSPERAARIWPYDVLRDIVTDALIRRYWAEESFRKAVAKRLSPASLRHISEVLLGYKLDESFWNVLAEREEKEPDRASSFQDERERIIRIFEQNRSQLGSMLRDLIVIEGAIEELREDLVLIPARLVGKEPEVYERWDRLRAEAEFRLSVALPLFALVLILATRLHPSLALLVLPCGYLVYEGLEKSRVATAQLAESLRAGRVNSPALERLDTGEPQWHSHYRTAVSQE